jgi:uncharacterized phage protein (predicted DNA packaging)
MMTDEEKEQARKKLLEECKKYNHIDYEDDEDIIELMIDVVFEEMGELIPGFDSENLSARQRLLVLISVKDLYDNREKYGKDEKKMQNAVSSMLLKEIYGGKE